MKRPRIRDARGRSVTRLDPVAMHLLRQHNAIEAEVLRAIAHEKGVSITRKERASLLLGAGMLVLVAGLTTYEMLTGGFADGPIARTASLAWFTMLSWVVWMSIRRARFGKISAAMLRYLRCPHCGYNLRMLPVDPDDGATVCPECGCAWRLDGGQQGGGHGHD